MTVEAGSTAVAVNTQDASVSLVDLASMKELQRYKVGARPYGIGGEADGSGHLDLHDT